ncbi:hypothetical protein JTB14_009428 [Gonioctena quinquepunctata]|nr:hypothetical protein JTB14_009428 [Gonioctena quinquepunctata]
MSDFPSDTSQCNNRPSTAPNENIAAMTPLPESNILVIPSIDNTSTVTPPTYGNTPLRSLSGGTNPMIPPSGGSTPVPPPPSHLCHLLPPSRPKSLMESLLVAKMEQVTLGQSVRQLVRTDSADSASSFGSINSTTASDICRCDDCLLGIGDLSQQEATEEKRKKVRLTFFFS